MGITLLEPKWAGYLIAALSIAAVTAVLKAIGTNINSTTVALVLLLNVLFVATRWGSLPALVASVVAMLCFNFFFLPPFGTFAIATPDNWIALAAFLIIAITAGQLSARATRRAEEADSGRREIERLYAELRDAFERASHAEALKQSEKLKSALLDAVTHDLRTPLTSVKASITTLLDEARGGVNGEQPVKLDVESRLEMMEIIDQESDRLNRFINDLIELARIEAGKLQLRRRWGAVEEIVSTALARAEPLTQRHKLEIDIESELPVVRVDERAVGEVVYVLVDNAAKYSRAGSNIRIVAQRARDGMVQMAVEDKGIGIAVELRERVFDKFFRAMHNSDITLPTASGTGMGLAIAKGIVEAHDGRIWIEDASDSQGTRVCFTLPIGDEDATESSAHTGASI